MASRKMQLAASIAAGYDEYSVMRALVSHRYERKVVVRRGATMLSIPLCVPSNPDQIDLAILRVMSGSTLATSTSKPPA